MPAPGLRLTLPSLGLLEEAVPLSTVMVVTL